MPLSKPIEQGLFLTLEGGDGSGKTSLQSSLSSYLSSLGYPVVTTRAPGGTLLGGAIREILLHKTKIPLCKRAELFLFLADRSQHVKEIILPALHQKKLVLCDRFNDSTIAYQGGAREIDLSQIAKLCHFAVEGLEPHLTFYLDLDPEEGLRRAQGIKSSQDRLEQEALEFHRKVRTTYLDLAREHPSRIYVIDAMQSQEEVFQEVCRKLLSYLEG